MARKQSASNQLTDTKIKSYKPKEKDYLVADGNGLYINIKTIGSKVWTIRYTVDGKQKKTTIGNYPTVPLVSARETNKNYQALAKQGICAISQNRAVKEEKQLEDEGRFHKVAKRYFEERRKGTICDLTYKQTLRRFEGDILSFFATFKQNSQGTFDDVVESRSIRDITHRELLNAILAIEKRGAIHTAHRAMMECNRLWLYAVQLGYADNNIVANIDKKHALKKQQKTHFASTTNEKEIKSYFEFADGFKKSLIARYALKLLPYVFLRAGNLRFLEWREIDFENKVLTIEAAKMKVPSNGDFIFPLHDTAIEIIKEVKPYTQHSIYVFASANNKSRPISNNTLSKALRDNGFAGILTPHGIRATFSSLAYTHMHEHNVSERVIEACLHHVDKNEVAGAYRYNAKYFEQMKILIKWWGDYLDNIKNG